MKESVICLIQYERMKPGTVHILYAIAFTITLESSTVDAWSLFPPVSKEYSVNLTTQVHLLLKLQIHHVSLCCMLH